MMSKFLGSALTLPNAHPPIYSNNPSWHNVGYDRVTSNSSSETPAILSGKEELAPEYLFSPYWYSFYKNLNLKHSYSLVLENIEKSKQFYLPQVLEYSEYDFRNNQAQESLEDAFWESNYSAFSHEDYMGIKSDSIRGEYFNKPLSYFNLSSRSVDKKSFVDLEKFETEFLKSPVLLPNATALANFQNTINIPNLCLSPNTLLGFSTFLKYTDALLYRPTPIKGSLLYLNSLSSGAYFNFVELIYTNINNTRCLNFIKSVNYFHFGINNLTINNVDNIKSLVGLG
jgi:hypothetical protein